MQKWRNRVIQLGREIIQVDTAFPPGNEIILAKQLGKILSDLGFETIIQNVLGEDGKVMENRSNLLARIGNPHGKKVMLCGHLDVVAAGTGWNQADPFCVEEKDGKLYGRGTADMKFAVAAIITVAEKLVEESFDFSRGQLLLLFTAVEEIGNMGVRTYIASDLYEPVDYGLIGEPTELELHIAQRGGCRMRVQTLGKAAHASDPLQGINAITKMAKVLEGIDDLNKKMQERRQPLLQPPSIAATLINGGVARNAIPGLCEIQLDRRTVEGESNEFCMNEIRSICEAIKKNDPEFNYKVLFVSDNCCGVTKIDSPSVQAGVRAYKKVFKREPVPVPFPANGDLGHLIQAKSAMFYCGPGSLKQAHVVDEYVEIDQVYLALEVFEEFVCQAFSEF
ncbi:MAG: ArgE/DapE family deacylase [Spirochaetia bacterium]|jgi:acetylornithine deacetylase/succinyl-diaminopimelate desuccinylase family protein|nr:ArgE/DapE family deacylase [Spirochaetia bacterium]